jgi:glycogen(starch) synthase
VDTDMFRPVARDADLAAKLGLGNEVVLGYIGTLSRYEGVSWLVKAVGELRRRGVFSKLMILGAGEDAPAIAGAIEDGGLQDYVLPIGKVSHEQVQRYYSVVDILVYPRRSTRLTELVTPLKPLEAMSLGKPVLASRIGGILELIEHERTGLLFNPDDVDDFCHQAKRLIEQEGLRRDLGSQARRTMLRERDWKILVRRYGAVYEFARNRKGTTRGTVAGI